MLNRNSDMQSTQNNPYLVQKIMTASPEQLIAYVYDAAISACAREDHAKALEAVQELVNALNFDAGEVTKSFHTVYQHVMDLLRKRQFAEAQEVLSELRQTWKQAMNLN